MSKRVIILCLILLIALVHGSAAADTEVTLTVAFWGAQSEYNDIWVPVKNEFEASHSGIGIELMHVAGSMQEKMISMALGGQIVDVWMSNADTALTYYTAGITRPLNSLMENDATFNRDRFFPAALEAYARDGIQYGLSSHFQVTSVWYNKELFDRAGLLYPKDDWTWEQFRADAKKLTQDHNNDGLMDQWGLALPHAAETMTPWVFSAGGDWVDDSDHPTRSAVSEPATLKGLQFIYELLTQDAVVEPGNGLATPFYEGKVGMYSYYAVAQRMASFATFDYNVARLPAGPAGAINSLVPGGLVMGKTNHEEEAWQFMKFFCQKGAFSYNTVPAYLPMARTNRWPFVPVPSDYNRAAFVEGALSARPQTIKHARVADILRTVNEVIVPAVRGGEALGSAVARADSLINAILAE
ncbi:MAG: ABC transporter substrate-binding protein [Limnochordia bacterium]